LDVLEINDKKIMKCKNPWGHTIPTFFYKFTAGTSEENGVFYVEWEYILEYFNYIFLAWNIEIYPFKYNFVSSWNYIKSLPQTFYDENISLEYNPQFLITIPEHKDDFEMRIVLTKHISKLDNSNTPRKTISFKLFWYEGYPIVYPINTLRSMQNCRREVNSDVFIFEASSQIEHYVLVIIKNDEISETTQQETNFSLDVIWLKLIFRYFHLLKLEFKKFLKER
jgi:hypothetical protein